MGMGGALAQRWAGVNDRYIEAIGRLSDVASSFGSVSKVLRLLLQSVILGLGAYLVIQQELTAGAMIAASIMMGRALAPIETAIANWRGFVARAAKHHAAVGGARARRAEAGGHRAARAGAQPRCRACHGRRAGRHQADRRQRALRASRRARRSASSGRAAPARPRWCASSSASGRLPRARVRLDGAALDQWDPDLLGQHIGFISQTVELFDGTISENIARMSVKPDADAVLRAAQRRRRARHDPAAAERLRHPDRRRRRGALGRAAAAHRARARALRRSVPGRARRAELQSRQRGRGGAAPGASSTSRRAAPSSC